VRQRTLREIVDQPPNGDGSGDESDRNAEQRARDAVVVEK
jgi:hypothetical protein